jgi:hypothetical protein
MRQQGYRFSLDTLPHHDDNGVSPDGASPTRMAALS